MTISKIILFGQKIETSVGEDQDLEYFENVKTIEVQDSLRSGANEEEVEVKEGEVYELDFGDGSVWLGDSEALLELSPSARLRGEEGTYFLPKEIEIYDEQRSLSRKVIVHIFKVFGKKKAAKIVDGAIHAAAKNFEDKSKGEIELGELSGKLFQFTPDLKLTEPNFSNLNQPYLLLIHGTASSTSRCFGDLTGSEEWREIRKMYGDDHILTFENRSLTCSPLHNMLDLIKELPPGIELDILCHSRGGIIADILARYATHQKGWDEFERKKFRQNKREKDESMLLEIEEHISGKGFKIRKIVRVGVPAAGTTLLTKRLDIFLNVFFNLLSMTPGVQIAAPLLNALKNLLLTVIERKGNVDVLPGLEAMVPDSPFIDMLNTPGTEMLINSPLYVITGNGKLALNPKAALTLISRIFYRGANDYVVDTKSMDKGAVRENNRTFVYHHHSTDLSHISYFKIEMVRQRVVNALGCAEGEPPKFYVPRTIKVLEEGEKRNALLGIDGGKVMRINVSGEKPIVLILPGIMGSNLQMIEEIDGESNGKMLWINYIRFLRGDLTKLEYLANHSHEIHAHSLVATSYRRIANYFNNNYDVVTLPFDWRIPVNESAKFLDRKIQDLMAYGQPIKVIAHSMGGVLFRNWMFLHHENFKKLNQLPGFKTVFLGSPLQGSFRILYVLFGRDGIIKKLAKIDRKNSIQDLVKVFSTMPGILNLLPIQSNGHKFDFSDAALWKKMRKNSGNQDWPIPDKNALADFGNFQKAVLEGENNIIWENLYYIAGLGRRKKPTIADIDFKNDELCFIGTRKGDESVTWESGIPGDLISGNRVYYANTTHGGLSTKRFVFKAIEQIFSGEKGVGLSQSPPQIRGNDRIEEKDIPFPEEVFDLSEESLEHDLLNVVRDEEDLELHHPLKVWVSNGDLKYADHPVLAGHFKFDGILTSELAIDRHLNGELRKLLQLNLYPGDIGSNIVVLNHSGKAYGSQFKGTVIIGLGVPGELSGYQLMKSVEQGVAKYLMTFNGTESKNQTDNVTKIGISCIAMANTYGGLSTKTSVRSIISGINRGNQKIAALFPHHVRLVEEVEFIEAYHDTAVNIHKCISQLENTIGGPESFDLIHREIKPKPGRLKRIPMENSQDWWTRVAITIEKAVGKKHEMGSKYLKVAMSTTGSSERVAEVYGDFATFKSMVDDLGKNHQNTPELAKTLFERLIPVEFKEEIKRQNNIIWVLDKSAASIPWEMIQDDIHAEPISVHAGMVRQLSTYDARVNGNLVSNHRALVIGDPDLENYYNQLPGAKREGEDLTKTFEGNGYETVSLINRSYKDILIRLFSSEYKILHLAGHGIFDPENGITSGMLIGNKKFLSPADIKQMSAVPELVFVNCCYLGESDAKAEKLSQNRNKLAANIGTQLIENGVKAVIVAGWAIDDTTAYDFAINFYREMFMGNTFGDAIKQARKRIYKNSFQYNNSWGAYQCYGDPFFRLIDPSSSSQEDDVKFSNREEAEIELGNLFNRVDSGDYIPREVLQRLAMVLKVIDKQNLKTDRTIELAAGLFGRLGKYEEAVELYEQLLKRPKAGYSVKSLEEYCNILTKSVVRQHINLVRKLKPGLPKEESTQLRDAIRKSAADGLKSIDQALSHLSNLSVFSETGERWALMGSAHKRKMMLYDENSKDEIIKCLQKAEEFYKNAYEAHEKEKKPYSANNVIPIHKIRELINWDGDTIEKEDPIDGHVKFLREKLDEIKTNGVNPQEMDYWDQAFQANTQQSFYLMDLEGEGKVEIMQVYDAYRKLWNWTGNYFNKIAEIENLEILIKPLEVFLQDEKSGRTKSKKAKDTENQAGAASQRDWKKAKMILKDLKWLRNKLEEDLEK